MAVPRLPAILLVTAVVVDGCRTRQSLSVCVRHLPVYVLSVPSALFPNKNSGTPAPLPYWRQATTKTTRYIRNKNVANDT